MPSRPTYRTDTHSHTDDTVCDEAGRYQTPAGSCPLLHRHLVLSIKAMRGDAPCGYVSSLTSRASTAPRKSCSNGPLPTSMAWSRLRRTERDMRGSTMMISPSTLHVCNSPLVARQTGLRYQGSSHRLGPDTCSAAEEGTVPQASLLCYRPMLRIFAQYPFYRASARTLVFIRFRL